MEISLYKALDVTQFVINYYIQKGTFTTNLGLNKILFFIQCYFLRYSCNNKPCFEDGIEAWPLGPVVPSVYEKCRVFGSSNIIYDIGANVENINDEKDIEILKKISDKLKNYKSWQLVNITHKKGGSWASTPIYQVIPHDKIKNDKTINFDKLL